MRTAPTFDIFRGVPNDKDVIWVGAVQGLADAKAEMERRAAAEPGPYFIFFSATHKILARIDTPAKPGPMQLRYPELQAALEILRKRGHIVGDPIEIGPEVRVRVDGCLMTREEVFEIVERHNRKHA